MSAAAVGVLVNGIKVIKASEHPKMTLAPDVMVSPEFRVEIDQWMLGFFGTTCLVPRGTMYKLGADTLVLHPADYDAVIREAREPRW